MTEQDQMNAMLAEVEAETGIKTDREMVPIAPGTEFADNTYHAMGVTKYSNKIVYIDGALNHVPREILKAILVHEVGHIALGHTGLHALSQQQLGKANQTREFEADAWAIRNGYGKALLASFQYLDKSNDTGDSTHPTPEVRIAKAKEVMNAIN